MLLWVWSDVRSTCPANVFSRCPADGTGIVRQACYAGSDGGVRGHYPTGLLPPVKIERKPEQNEA